MVRQQGGLPHRMALADGAELIIMAPALCEFGEDKTIDALIRKYGYRGTPHTWSAPEKTLISRTNLSAPAHLIHGSSEGRFTITYAPSPEVTKEEIEDVGYRWGDLAGFNRKYKPESLKDGWNNINGEEIYYISNPALGLWAYKERFKD